MSFGVKADRFLIFANLLSVLCHLWAINTPPTGAHAWRQCDGAAVARNFYEEERDIFHPAVDARGAGDGVIGMEFSLVNWLTAGTYHLIGFQHWSGRAVVVLFSLLGNVYFYGLARRFIVPAAARWALLIWIFGPTYFYYSRNIMPDVPALAMAVGAFYWFERAEASNWKRGGFLYALHLALAGLIKIPYAHIGFVCLAWHFLRRPRAVGDAKFLICSGIAALPVAAWWLHARALVERSGQEYVVIGPEMTLNPHILIKTIRHVVLQGIPENLLSYSISGFLVLFIIVFLLRRKEKLPPDLGFLLAAWLMAAAAQMFFLARKLTVHDYMWLPLFPALALSAGMGVEYAWRKARPAILKAFVVAALLSTPLFLRYQFARQLSSPWAPPAYLRLEAICDRFLERGARVIAAPDPAPGIVLYYAHRKGWSFRENAAIGDVARAIQEGGRYLISGQKTYWERAELQALFPRIIYADSEVALRQANGVGKN